MIIYEFVERQGLARNFQALGGTWPNCIRLRWPEVWTASIDCDFGFIVSFYPVCGMESSADLVAKSESTVVRYNLRRALYGWTLYPLRR